ncbi:helix-turn-helix transcriptional regulator [Pseudomonas gingeri]|uniref:Helix-turn-helix transcriptional regulator n=1 Tax=Pseudomonas gingeri TaxID=117681 RepID=A0A7Y8CM15_9PSED|nr:AraC family transcriptional regulator [Pseudomonas gingeri]NWB31429.1 helix-turn-helix transcriptional regulator [Pseudomonas gingeri]NWC35706.1 helix-turn-helix transcriptional regulator [Pseudomonas gingeri]NWD49443.1 helix-turn-helix transcriptional regulator [Pseudomonas gingeri]
MERIKPVTTLQLDDARWLPPSGAALKAQALCMLARPRLKRAQHATDFRFFEATLLVVTSGHLTLARGERTWELADSHTLMVVAKNSITNIQKTPDKNSSAFTSLFLTFAPSLITEFYQHYGHNVMAASIVEVCKTTELDEDLNDALQFCVRGINSPTVSEAQKTNRLIGFLLALQERNIVFARPSAPGLAERLTQLLANEPEKHWTAALAGRDLAVSEATLRRRLAEKGISFRAMLTEIRMHHAMMLLQTTHFSISQIADACGYRAISRFSMRFKSRFGFSPRR